MGKIKKLDIKKGILNRSTIKNQDDSLQNVISQNVSSQNVSYQNVSSKNVSSQNVSSQNVSSQNVSSQNVSLKKHSSKKSKKLEPIKHVTETNILESQIYITKDLKSYDLLSLFNQASSDQFQNILSILSKNPELLNIKDIRNGNTFLFYAISNRNIICIIQLLKLGCNPNIQNDSNIDCINNAIINLLSYKSTSNGCIIKDLNILLIFTLQNEEDIKKIPNISSSFEKIKKIIDKKDEDGNTLLHYLISNNKLDKNIDLCIMIIKYIRPNLDNVNNKGDSILHTLIHHIIDDFNKIEYFDLLQTMIRYGAKQDIYDSKKKLANDYLMNCFV
jgi:ankyrin repeat protein